MCNLLRTKESKKFLFLRENILSLNSSKLPDSLSKLEIIVFMNFNKLEISIDYKNEQISELL